MYCRSNDQCSITCYLHDTGLLDKFRFPIYGDAASCNRTNLYSYAGSPGQISIGCINGPPNSCVDINQYIWGGAYWNARDGFQWVSQPIDCDWSGNCAVLCKEPWSCAYTTITCPQSYTCYVECTAEYACAFVSLSVSICMFTFIMFVTEQ